MRIGTLAALVKFEHTIFALPFAFTGALLGARGWPSGWEVLWITLAMVGARTAAMAFNRLIDQHIDALNPRTRNRHLPQGLVPPWQVALLGMVALALLITAALALNPLCVLFLPLVVPVLIFYPYTKRFTPLCHFALGAAQFFAPFGGWIAVTGRVEPGAVLLGLAAGLWVAGFDVIYATQDGGFDREHGIHSLVVWLGTSRALRVARGIHGVVVLLLAALIPTAGLGVYFGVGVAVVAALLHYEHTLVRPGDLSRLDTAFFNINALVSVVLLLFTLIEVAGGA